MKKAFIPAVLLAALGWPLAQPMRAVAAMLFPVRPGDRKRLGIKRATIPSLDRLQAQRIWKMSDQSTSGRRS